ncbi:MAG: SusE domain-containing protein [Nitritalea sp.]
MNLRLKFNWLFVIAALLWACNDVEQPSIIIQTPATILSAPSEILTADADEDGVFVFTVSPADFGANVGVEYTIQMDRPGNNFASPANLGSSNETSVEVSISEINGRAIALGVAPGEMGPMEFRVRAIPAAALPTLVGAAVTINIGTMISVNPDVPLTLEELTGDGTKAWKLRPTPGSWGVGPAPGDIQWFPGASVNLSLERPCTFNDRYIFSADGTFEFDAQGDFWGEGWMGVGPGCQPEANLEGTPSAAFQSATHTFNLVPGAPNVLPQVAVTGTGAFIGFSRAFNGGEIAEGQSPTNRTITYTVRSYNPDTQEIVLSINSGADGDVFWTFVLIPAED